MVFTLLAPFTLLLICVVLRAVYNIALHPLRKYPGPWWQAVSRLPYTISVFQGEATRRTKELHDKYGPIVRITPNTLSYSCSQAWSDIYGATQSDGRGNIPKDPNFYSKASQGLPTISIANDEDHRRLRRIQAHAFSDKALSVYEDTLKHYTSLFILRLREQTEQDCIVNLVHWLNLLTTDVIGELTFGESLEGLANSQLHPWLDSVFGTIKMSGFTRELSAWPAFIKRFALLFVSKQRDEHLKVAMFGIEAAKRRMEISTDKPDFMSHILKHNNGEQQMSRAEIEAAAITFIVAGSETTATLLSGTLYYLCMNPMVMRRLTSGIRASFPKETDLNLVRLQQHEYLTAVLQEGLRLYPPAPDSLFRRTPASGSVVAGEMIPPHTSVTVNLWAANRSHLNFHRPNEFIPERWMKQSSPEFETDDKKVLKPFSIGPRDCLGKNLAWAEMRIVLGYMLWHFNFKLEQDSQDWIDRQKIYVLWEKPELQVRMSLRMWET